MIKSILVATDGSDHAWSACQYALDLAQAHNALLRVISVVDTRVFHTVMAGEGIVADLYDPALRKKMEADQRDVLAKTEWRAKSGTYRWN